VRDIASSNLTDHKTCELHSKMLKNDRTIGRTMCYDGWGALFP
jgi:hypothetical protein